MIKLNKIGSDPEFGIVDNNGRALPSFMFIEGTKNNPEEFQDGFFLLKDNLLIEGNIPPASSKEEFIENMEFLKTLANAVLTPKGAKIVCVDSLEYGPEFINTEEAQVFGCASFDHAYSEAVMRAPKNKTNSRTVGFHLHYSYDIQTVKYDQEDINYVLAKAFDYFLTIPSDKIHYCKDRRESYGLLGSFRHTYYGLECRQLGGFFTQKQYLEWAWDQSVKMFDFVSNEENFKKLQSIKFPKEEHYELLGINLEEQIPYEAKVKELHA